MNISWDEQEYRLLCKIEATVCLILGKNGKNLSQIVVVIWKNMAEESWRRFLRLLSQAGAAAVTGRRALVGHGLGPGAGRGSTAAAGDGCSGAGLSPR